MGQGKLPRNRSKLEFKFMSKNLLKEERMLARHKQPEENVKCKEYVQTSGAERERIVHLISWNKFQQW